MEFFSRGAAEQRTRMSVPTTDIFKETKKYFDIFLSIPYFSLSRQQPLHIFSSSFLLVWTLFLREKPDSQALRFTICYFVKGESHFSRFREEPMNLICTYFAIVSISLYLCVFFVSWLSSQLVKFRVLGIMDQWARQK